MSIINRHNYEEYFLLYIDDELTTAERTAVEEFLNMHPDLKIELEMLQQSTLQSEHIVFHEKDLLLKNTSSKINANNYEEYFVLYADDELNNEEKDSVEQFVYCNAQYQAEFELILKAKVEADRHVVFPDKSLLYRTEKEDEKVFVLRWWKIAAAAVALFFLTGAGWYIISEEKTTTGIVNTTPNKKPASPVPAEPVQKPEGLGQKPEGLVKTNSAGSEVTSSPIINAVVANKAPAARKKVKQTPEQMLTEIKVPEKATEGRNIQLATNVATKRPEVKIGEMGAASNISMQSNSNKKIVDEAMGPVEENVYAFTASNDDIEILNTTVSKKNKLRGLFRKVSRVVEKTTSIEPGDVKGIRIANFELDLK